MLMVGILSALGLLLLALKAGGKKAIGHDIFVDVLITVTLMVCFYGTFSGMTAAMVGGLVASITLFLMKKFMVHKKLRIETYKKKLLGMQMPMLSFSWQTKQPEWRHHNQYWRE